MLGGGDGEADENNVAFDLVMIGGKQRRYELSAVRERRLAGPRDEGHCAALGIGAAAQQGHGLVVAALLPGRVEAECAELGFHVARRDAVAVGPRRPSLEQVVGQEADVKRDRLSFRRGEGSRIATGRGRRGRATASKRAV